MSEITVRVPGKLYLAGEYGVVASATSALVLPTKLKLTVTVTEAEVQSIYSTQWKEEIVFSWVDGCLPESFQGPWADAVRLIKRYLRDYQVGWRTSAIHIASDLDQNDQKKWGLGSSGALTVGLVEALLAFHDISVEKTVLYKLCVLAQLDHLEETSFGDVACSVFQVPLKYHMPNRNYLRHIDKDNPFLTLNETWPDLLLEGITATLLPMIVVNTGVPAQTHKLVKSVLAYQRKRWFERRMRQIDTCVETFHCAWLDGDFDVVGKAVKRHHVALTKLGRKAKQMLVTSAIKDLFKTMKPHLSAWKFSGAGGGDNVLLFPKTENDHNAILANLPEGMTDLTGYIEGVKS